MENLLYKRVWGGQNLFNLVKWKLRELIITVYKYVKHVIKRKEKKSTDKFAKIIN